MASTFSYAQAAKGISTPATTSKPASSSATPAKDAISASAQDPNAAARSWAEDVEIESLPDQPTKAREARPERSASNAAKIAPPVDASNVSSPDLGALSSSTVNKDDDVSSNPNTASESTTWDNKSQASTSVDKTVEPVEKTSDKVKKGKSAVAKALQEAPVPTVNPWKLRADEMKAKVQKVTPLTAVNGTSHGPNGVQQKKGDSAPQEKATNGDGRSKGREAAQGRKDAKADADAKNSTKGRLPEKEAKAASTVLPPPPNRDQESWPTPEIAIDEDRKKAQEKGDKAEKDRKDGASTSKHEWVKVPFTPSVVFNTPLPNAAGARRGGRPGGRGGAAAGGRPTGVSNNGAEQAEKDGSAPGVVPNGEQTRRERPEAAARETSPKAKRNGSAASPTLRDQVPVVNGDGATKATGPAASEGEAQHRRSSVSSQMPGQNGTYARQYPNKPHKGRRGDLHSTGERRRDGAASPTKDNTWDERRISAGMQTDAFGDGERRAPTYQDGTHGHSKRFGSFSNGRERGGGRGRGGRGGYTNGHQFTNGHTSSTFPLRSPTTFVPDNNSFFAPQGKYRNSHRSQSLTADPYRYPPYQNNQNGYPVPPIQTSHEMYNNYGMVQPMSAGLPYSPYGVDQNQIFVMVAAQVDYYFSVDNLLKDMYLRKHMDSQGFVSLEFIAGFNRIKNLSPDLDLIRLVCQQSSVIEYRTSESGQDRLRRKDGWANWVLDMAERDASAQNEGPKELNQPQLSRPAGLSQWPMSPGFPAGPYGNDGAFTQTNGFHGAPQDAAMAPTEQANGTAIEDTNGTGVPNDESSIKAVSGEPDSFSNLQLDTLTVVVRKQNQSQLVLPLSVSRTFSNGSIDSKHGVPDDSEKSITCQLRVDGSGPFDGSVENHTEEHLQSATDPFRSTSPVPVRLYWVKDQDNPVHSIPSDSSHESYYHLRSKALHQRQNANPGTTPYDMDVLYQFWSHFLIRNFNLSMYNEFRHLAFEDATDRETDVGLSNLLKFYRESLLSPQGMLRERVASDYIDLVKAEDERCRPAFEQLQSAFRNGSIDPLTRKRIDDMLDADTLALLVSQS